MKRPWDTQQWVYILSSIASIVAMMKAIFMYYTRYHLVKKGFVVEAIDDIAYLFELLERSALESNGNEKEVLKVANRMKSQKTTLNAKNKYHFFRFE